MPSTSGDASDFGEYHKAFILAWFQCPQYRAMHLTLQDAQFIYQVEVSMPSTSGDNSGPTKSELTQIGHFFLRSPLGDVSDKNQMFKAKSAMMFRCPQHRAMHLT